MKKTPKNSFNEFQESTDTTVNPFSANFSPMSNTLSPPSYKKNSCILEEDFL